MTKIDFNMRAKSAQKWVEPHNNMMKLQYTAFHMKIDRYSMYLPIFSMQYLIRGIFRVKLHLPR